VLVFIVTILLLAADFYYLKNIAGRRLVGLRWWNEVNGSSGDSHWVFESAPQPNEPGGKVVTPTDKRFFWLALYAQPGLWVALAIVAIVRLHFLWLTLVGMLRFRIVKCLEECALIGSQLLHLPLPSQTLSLSPDATSSARQAACSKQASTLLPWQETLVVLWSLACSTGARLCSGFISRNSCIA
jgi:hypothetical protein